RVRRAEVERLDGFGGPEVVGKRDVEARSDTVLFRAVGRDLETQLLEDGPVTDRPVADDAPAAPASEPSRRPPGRPPPEARAHFAPRGVDHGHGARSTGRERIESRDAGHRDLEGQCEAAGRREPDADSGEAPRADAHDERVEVRGREGLLREQLMSIREYADGF